MRVSKFVTAGIALAGVALAVGTAAPVHAIMGGGLVGEAVRGEFTSVLSLHTERGICGATYIGQLKVLTAAHCVLTKDGTRELSAELMTVRGNSLSLNSDGSTSAVRKIHVHPDYSHKNGGINDIAVLILNEQPAGVKPARLAGSSYPYEEGRLGYLAGWGLTEAGGVSMAMRAVPLVVKSQADCVRELPKGLVTDVMMCAVSTVPGEAAGAGKGDSGGPLLMKTDSGTQIVGVASWVYEVDKVGRVTNRGLTVFTRVKEFINWISKIPVDVVPSNSAPAL